MKNLNNPKHWLLLSWLLACVAMLLPQMAKAQCPVAANCTPGNATNTTIPGTGIFNVKLGTLNKTTQGVTQGYGNFACTDGTSLIKSAPYAISVTTGNVVEENVRVWIDYDNNGVFDATGELAFSSNNKKVHTGTVTIPATAITGTPLRMRVSADLISAAIPTPCSTPTFSQVEDYKITATENVQGPIARFKVQGDSITCNGVLNFIDESPNSPDTWLWNFGDGSTSDEQNPQHVYNQSGVYSVKLIVSNSNGIDSLTRNNYINFNDSIPRLASCDPITLSACCGYGITQVKFNTITNNSAASTSGYENFTCKRRTYLYEGRSYPINLITSPNDNQDTRVYLDVNDDGIFTVNELLLQVLNAKNPSGNIVVPIGAVRDRALRLRVWSDYAGAPFAEGACTNPTKGQVEDYTVIVLENTLPPVANFAVASSPCNPTFTFTNTSQNRVDSLVWYFGNGDSLKTANVNSVSYTYTTAGAYTVRLKALSPFGTDIRTRVQAAVYVQPPVAASCTPVTTAPQGGMGIGNVKFNTINNTTGGASEGYGNFTCSQTTSVVAGNNYMLTVTTTSNNNGENVLAWIDYNNNGIFADNELVLSAGNSFRDNPVSANVLISNNSVKNKNLRMRVISNFQGQAPPSACGAIQGGQLFGQAEDYGVIILENVNPPVANFIVKNVTNCNTVAFRDTSLNSPTAWFWNFGDGNTSTLQNPTHTYTTSGTFTVQLKVTNAFGVDSLVQTDIVNVLETQGLLAASCTPISTNAQDNLGIGILNVTLSNIDNSSGNAFDDGGYKDFSCTQRANVTAGTTYDISITTGPQFEEQVKVWIDYNYDGIFDPSTELAFEAIDQQGAPVNPKVGTITIPNTAAGGTALRMRVSSDYFQQDISDPCQDVTFGQVEDYSLIVTAGSNPPEANFNFRRATCSRSVQFTDNSANQPASWLWKFGDGTTSTQRNPIYTYAATGTYTVRLIATNVFGIDSVDKVLVIGATATSTILPIACQPATIQQFAGIGITNVKLGTINNTTPDAATDSYKDYSCTQTTTLTAGNSYTLGLTVGTQFAEKIAAWIDYNNDGVLDNATELLGRLNPPNGVIGVQGITFAVPTNVVLNRSLRMRVSSDFFNGSWNETPCGSPQYGQVEDYAVTIQENTLPPVAGFAASSQSICLGAAVVFTDTSANAPTAWLWNFGDGNTSTAKSPTHTYTSAGTYTVTLAVTNNFGNNSVTQTNYIVVNPAINLTATNCQPITQQPNANFGIFNVQFGGINKTSAGSTDGYKDYACEANTGVVVGVATPITVRTGTAQNESVRIWIDLNNNGLLETNENLFNSINRLTNHTGNITIPATAVLNQYLRMRVISDRANSAIQQPCQNRTVGQVEDYAVRITTVGLQISSDNDLLQMYPNPSEGIVKLQMPEMQETKAEITVVNALGQTAYTEKVELPTQVLEHELDLSGLPSGVYFVKVQSGKQLLMKKLVRQ